MWILHSGFESFLILGVAPQSQESAPGGAEVDEIRMTAKKYEFNPAVITVKQGRSRQARDHRHGPRPWV
jgi:hypothetical protein